MGSFETSDGHPSPSCQPLRVAVRKDELYQSAREMVDDLASWTLLEADDERLALTCEKKGGMLGGTSRIEITIEGPDGIPSSTVNVRSKSEGGLLSRDKANVVEFMRPFHRRVC